MGAKGTNASDMKLQNQATVLRLVRSGSFSRADIARKTGLTRAAVTNIADECIAGSLIFERKSDMARVGRTPHILTINPDARYALGLDLSRQGYRLGLCDLAGKVRETSFLAPETPGDWRSVLDAILCEMQRLLEKASYAKGKILGLGITAPGPLNRREGVILNPPNFSRWKDAPVVSYFADRLPFPVLLEHNAKALAKAEKHYGSGKALSAYIELLVDNGIGAGIIINEKLYHGTAGFEGEIGHCSIDYRGLPCPCGNTGCLELYAALPAIVAEAGKEVPGIADWPDIVDRALAGDAACYKIVEKEADYLFCGINHCASLFGITDIILFGRLCHRSGLLRQKLAERFQNAGLYRNAATVSVYDSALSENAGILSAANIMLDSFFEKFTGIDTKN